MRFISPKTDFAFKKIFGSNESKDLLISFLNALIYQGEFIIQDLEIIDPYNPGDTVDLKDSYKDSYLDVKALLNDGSNVIIEMQVLNVAAFEKRVVYNLCKTYGNQLQSGQGYSKLKPVIALTITDFQMFNETHRIINRFVFKEKEELFNYRDQELEMIFVELPKFTKKLEELETVSDKWIYFMKEAPSLEAIPTTLAEIQEIEKALNIANQANLTAKELEEVRKREIFVEDRRGEIILARQEGRLEGEIRVILRLLEQRFGKISTATIDDIQKLSSEQLELLVGAIWSFTSWEDLSNWWRNNQPLRVQILKYP